MKTFVALACLFAVAFARPQNPADREAVVVAEESELNPDDGSYSFSFKTSNGISREESGKQKQLAPEEVGTVSTGAWSYTAPDGSVVKVNFVADENGYQPSSDLLPVGPPAPAYVVKLLEGIARRAAAAAKA